MSKFTPGPWKYTGVFVEANGEAVAAPCGDSEMRGNNGPILAAAPEMYEALNGLMTLICNLRHVYGNDAAQFLMSSQSYATAQSVLGKAGAQ